ncbi:MAG: hypothetical protein K2J15_07170 [Muribaculaceae bacterium]|nr:hypothetical protein [Muribaculaceae bacterium]
MRKKIEPDLLVRLRNDVEKHLARKLVAPADFVFLSDKLQKESHAYVSSTTLKRVWGYISDKGNEYSPSNYTLRALCQLIGFKDLSQYMTEDIVLQSMDYNGEYIETSRLPTDTEITLFWYPNRKIRMRHIQSSIFEIMYNENSRLKTGDVVECGSLTQHAPAFFRVSRSGHKPFSYVAGTDQGVCFIIYSDDDGAS